MRSKGDTKQPLSARALPLVTRAYSPWSSLRGVSKPHSKAQLTADMIAELWAHPTPARAQPTRRRKDKL